MSLVPDIDAFEEGPAIAQFDSGLSRSRAEALVAQREGFANASAYWAWLAECVLTKKVQA